MTPEEILAECPEFEYTYKVIKRMERDWNPDEKIILRAVDALAQSRKEARELREQLEKASKCSCIYDCNHHELKAFLGRQRILEVIS